MAVTNSLVLDGALALVLQTSGGNNPLTAGPYHLQGNVLVVSGVDIVNHVLAVETDADTCRILKMAYDLGGFAVWPIFDSGENLVGYLFVRDQNDNLLAVTPIDLHPGAYALATPTLTDGKLRSMLLDWLKGDGPISIFSGATDQVATAISGLKDMLIPV